MRKLAFLMMACHGYPTQPLALSPWCIVQRFLSFDTCFRVFGQFSYYLRGQICDERRWFTFPITPLTGYSYGFESACGHHVSVKSFRAVCCELLDMSCCRWWMVFCVGMRCKNSRLQRSFASKFLAYDQDLLTSFLFLTISSVHSWQNSAQNHGNSKPYGDMCAAFCGIDKHSCNHRILLALQETCPARSLVVFSQSLNLSQSGHIKSRIIH